MKFLGKYMQIKKRDIGIAWKKAKMSKTCYLFLLPYFILFVTFYVLPVCMSVFYSFTYYNVLEPAKFIGVENYIDLLLNDDVFLIAVKNTFLLAAITGPLGGIFICLVYQRVAAFCPRICRYGILCADNFRSGIFDLVHPL